MASVSCIAGLSAKTLTMLSSVLAERMRETTNIGLRPAGSAVLAFADLRWASEVAYVSSTIPVLSRSAVNGVVIARFGARTRLFRLAG